MAQMNHVFPPEIIAAIINDVAQEDALDDPQAGRNFKLKSTKACSQVCRAFLPHCREHIFHSVHVYDFDSPNHSVARRFVQLITNTPEIAGYIWKLDYGIRFHEETHFGDVTSALDQISSLKSLTFYKLGWQSSWVEIPTLTKASILRLIHLPTIVSLEFRGFNNFLISDLSPCPNLQDLYFHNIDTSEPRKKKSEVINVTIVPTGSVRPQSLKLAYTTFGLLTQKGSDNKPILDLSALRKIDILGTEEYDEENDMKWAKELLAQTNKLQCIEISAENAAMMEPALSLLTDSESILATLKVVFLTSYLYKRASDPLCGIPKALEKIAGKNQIEHLQIRLLMWGVVQLDDGKWGDLERVLLAPGWSSLRQVDLHLVPYNLGRTMTEGLKDLPQTQFPLLSMNENFKFDFRVSSP